MTLPARRPGRPPEIDPVDAAQALLRHNGNVTQAAAFLGCTPQGLRLAIRRSPDLQAALSEAREGACDSAESALLAAVKRGEAWAVCFVLRSWGRDRGFGREPPAASADMNQAQELFPLEPIRRRLPEDLCAELDEHRHEAAARGGPLDYSNFSVPLLIAMGEAERAWRAEQLESTFRQAE
jgi:hypothetical protein